MTTLSLKKLKHQSAPDQAVYLHGAWRVYWKGNLLKPMFNDKGPAEAFLDGLRKGRKPS